jgi:hypothetical protein
VRTPSAEQLVCHCAHCLSQGTSVLLVLCCSTCLTHPAEDKTMYGFVCCCLLLVAAVVLMLAPVYRPGVLSRVQQGRGWASVGAAAGVRYAQSSLPNSLHPLNHSLTHSLTSSHTKQAEELQTTAALSARYLCQDCWLQPEHACGMWDIPAYVRPSLCCCVVQVCSSSSKSSLILP